MTAPARSPTPKRRAKLAAPITHRTEGQRLFCSVSGTGEGIASRIGAAQRSVNEWQRGEATPGPKARQRIEAEFQIPASTWDRLPATALPPATEDEPEPDADTDAGDGGDGTEPPSLADDYRDQVAELRKALKRTDLLVRDRLLLNDAFGKALERRRKFELQNEMAEDRIIRDHPSWKRLKKLIFDALLAYPAAARAVGAAIEQALDDEGHDS